MIPPEVREGLSRPPLSGVQHLSLKVPQSSLTSGDVVEYLDNLLWLSPHPESISLYSEDSDFQLLLEVLSPSFFSFFFVCNSESAIEFDRSFWLGCS